MSRSPPRAPTWIPKSRKATKGTASPSSDSGRGRGTRATVSDGAHRRRPSTLTSSPTSPAATGSRARRVGLRPAGPIRRTGSATTRRPGETSRRTMGGGSQRPRLANGAGCRERSLWMHAWSGAKARAWWATRLSRPTWWRPETRPGRYWTLRTSSSGHSFSRPSSISASVSLGRRKPHCNQRRLCATVTPAHAAARLRRRWPKRTGS